MSVERIGRSLASEHSVYDLRFSSVDWKSAGVPAWRQVAWMRRNPLSLRRFAEALQTRAPDVILLHNLMPVGSAALYEAVVNSGVPCLYYIHNFRPFSVNGYLWANDRLITDGLKGSLWAEVLAGSWQNSRLKTAYYAWLLTRLRQKGIWDRMTGWIAISEFVRDRFIKAGIDPRKIHTIRHSWDASKQRPALAAGQDYLFLGRLTSAKGVLLLLDVWNRLKTRLGDRCPKLHIGGSGPLEGQIRDAALNHPEIQFHGFVSGALKGQLLDGCRALLAPSIWWEPLGLVVYDAYDHGRPVLGARSGGITETVVHGSTGLLHAPGDAASLEADILALERDPEAAAAMGQAGYRWLLANTGTENWLNQMNACLKWAVANQRADPEGSKTR